MRKEIREADAKRGIIQVTIADERWYLKSKINETTMLPEYEGVPSVTWITQSYPKGIQYFKWLADKGWDEAEAVKIAAGDKGSKVHLAIEAVLRGEEVRIDSKFINKNLGVEEELTLEECDAVISFVNWRRDMEKEYEIETLASEVTIFSDKYTYAGTIDWIVKLTHKATKEVYYWIIDFKTSQQVWPSHELQLSAYREGMWEIENYIEGLDTSAIKLAILQVGYRRNKNGYKFTEIEPCFNLFLAAQQIWQKEHGGESITKKDYPVVLSPAAPSELTTEEVGAITEARETEQKTKRPKKND